MRIAPLLGTAALIMATHTSTASIIFSGDFTAGTGQIQFTTPYDFAITDSETLVLIVFEDSGFPDISPTENFNVGNFSVAYAIDGGSTSTFDMRSFLENSSAFAYGIDVTNDDGSVVIDNGPALIPGQTFRLEAQTWTGIGAAGFNPSYNNIGTFTGNLFLASYSGPDQRLSDNAVVAVPEPSSLAVAFLGAAGLLAARRFRGSGRNK